MDHGLRSSWTKEQEDKLRKLISENRLTNVEIAKYFGVSGSVVASKLQKMKLNNTTYRKRQTKHKHLRKDALTFFLTHSFAETIAHFNLTASEMKSLFTTAYRDPKLAHLRKDHRVKTSWSFDETMFFLRHAGLQSRAWIAGKLGRGSKDSVKQLASRMSCNTKFMNGFSLRLARELLDDPYLEGIKTKTGPKSKSTDFRYITVPWVVLYSKGKHSKKLPPHILSCLKVLARFQKRIHGTRGVADTVAAIKQNLRKKGSEYDEITGCISKFQSHDRRSAAKEGCV